MAGTNPGPDPEVAKTLGLDSAKGRRRHWKRWVFWGLLLLAIALGVAGWQKHRNDAKIRYKTRAVTRGDLTVTVSATGNLQPTNQVEVGSELSGIVESVHVDYNDHVKVGEVLARLDPSKLDAQVLQARATLASARANEAQARATVVQSRDDLARIKKVRRMSRGKAVSSQDLVAAQAALDRAIAGEASAKASVSQAKAALEAIQTDLSKAAIRSPINGIVLSRSVDPGQTVAASLQAPVLFTLAEDLTKMQLIVDVDESDVAKVNAGQDATFTVDAYPDSSFPAKIVQVRFGPKTVDGVVSYETVLSVNNSKLLLRPGMTATAEIVVKKIQNAVLVPNAALRFLPPKKVLAAQRRNHEGRSDHSEQSVSNTTEDAVAKANRQKVWVLKKGQPAPVMITTGATDGTHTEVLGGTFEPGTELIVDTVSKEK